MKKLILLATVFFSTFYAGFAQNYISGQDAQSFFDQATLNKFDIHFPIYRIYPIEDKAGLHYCVLTESNDTYNEKGEPINKKIKAYYLTKKNNTYTKSWEMNDFVIESDVTNESSIWFWTKFSTFTDIDQDGWVDPILIYGSSGLNGTEDGRIKVLTYYKGKKVAIRHQNSTLDYDVKMQIDKDFYNLPQSIQNHIVTKLRDIEQANLGVFPNGWDRAIKNKKTTITK